MEIINLSDFDNIKIVDKYVVQALDEKAIEFLLKYPLVRRENTDNNRFIYKRYYSISLFSPNNKITHLNNIKIKTNSELKELSELLINQAYNIIINDKDEIEILSKIIVSAQFTNLYIDRINNSNLKNKQELLKVLNNHKYDIMIMSNIFIIDDINEMLNDENILILNTINTSTNYEDERPENQSIVYEP